MIRELPSAEWQQFLESFSLQHDRWLVNVENFRGKSRDLEAKNEPLDGIVARPREIIITIGADPAMQRRVIVRDPKHVRVESEDGVDQAIQIE